MSSHCDAKIIEKVIAVVDSEVITLTEFNKFYRQADISDKNITKKEALTNMIDTMLLIKKARNLLRGEKYNSDELIKHYIDRRIRAFIRIPFEDIEAAYKKNEDRYGDKKFYEVKEDIERELIEEKVKIRLREDKKILRTTAVIKINPFNSLANPLSSLDKN
jgi:hypothetical protein